jgi:hypothetical protein
VTIVVGLGIVVPLFRALPGEMSFFSTSVTGDARVECRVLGPVVESVVVLLRSWYCGSR